MCAGKQTAIKDGRGSIVYSVVFVRIINEFNELFDKNSSFHFNILTESKVE